MRMSFFFCNFARKIDLSRITMKYPVGVQNFEVLRKEGFVYVDKTDLIYELAQQHICFLCRPRRFGKSLTISTLEAYFQGKKELFKGLKISSLEKKWQKHPVFHIDFNGINFQETDALVNRLNDTITIWENQYGFTPTSVNIGDRFANLLERTHLQFGERCVVLIDEYDKPLLDVMGEVQEQTNRDTLKAFYSVFKLADAHLQFVLLTGVTKFSQVSVFSGFNQPLDISMHPKYESICGITEQELFYYFDAPISEVALQNDMSIEEMKSLLKRHYDGYHFSPSMTDIYNPFSLLNVFASSLVSDYWFSSGTPTYLIKLLKNNNVDVSSLLSRPYEAAYFIDYRANVADPLAMLYQSGYLTIKSVVRQESDANQYYLDFPNVEVKRGFISMLSNSYFTTQEDSNSIVSQIVRCLEKHQLDDLHLLLDCYFSSIDYEMRKDKEYHFQYTLYLIFSLMSTYNVTIERHNSQGRADMIVETKQHIYIFEFKLDGTAEEALQQIEDRQYAKPYLTDSRPLTKIGVSFGSKSGTIDEWMVCE